MRTTDDGRRGKCSARRLPPLVTALFFHTSRLVGYGWQHCRPVYMQRSQIFVQNRVFCLPHLHSTPSLGEFTGWNIAIPFGMEKLEWLGRATRRWKNFDATHERDRRTHRPQTPHADIGRTYASHRAAKRRAFAWKQFICLMQMILDSGYKF